MREIEFRGKRIDNGEWVFGYLNCFLDFSGKQYEIHTVENQLHCIVIPETVGQYTGLKDKNGVKIFEGDILRESENFIVVYDQKWAKFKLQHMRVYQYPEWNRGVLMKVIGNIHDNPELLKEAVNG